VEPGAVIVGSKRGYTYTADWRVEAERHEVKDHSLSTLRRQLAESRARLGRHLALYQIHSATFESGVLEDSAVLGELSRLREEGMHIGLSLSGPQQPDGPDVLAMAAVLAQPWVSVVLSGAASVAHVESHVRALSVGYDEVLDARLSGMVEAPSVYWATRSALPWN
jgi:aryl-alcohol dehydrogenase-like predicted oxidoreductase